MISYTITVENIGNVDADRCDGDRSCLPSGATCAAATSRRQRRPPRGRRDLGLQRGHTVTQAETTATPAHGLLVNVATVDTDQTGPDSDDAAVPVAQNPALNIVKDADQRAMAARRTRRAR